MLLFVRKMVKMSGKAWGSTSPRTIYYIRYSNIYPFGPKT